MGLRKILTDKDPALHKVCKSVEVFDRKSYEPVIAYEMQTSGKI